MSPPETPKKESLKENEDLAIKENGTTPREIGDKIKVESAGEYETPELTSDEENLVQLQTPRKRRKYMSNGIYVLFMIRLMLYF